MTRQMCDRLANILTTAALKSDARTLVQMVAEYFDAECSVDSEFVSLGIGPEKKRHLREHLEKSFALMMAARCKNTFFYRCRPVDLSRWLRALCRYDGLADHAYGFLKSGKEIVVADKSMRRYYLATRRDKSAERCRSCLSTFETTGEKCKNADCRTNISRYETSLHYVMRHGVGTRRHYLKFEPTFTDTFIDQLQSKASEDFI